jgi:hypothetical protein
VHTLDVRNVCEALPAGLRLLEQLGTWEDSRNGRVLIAPGPVATVYHKPMERVLVARGRDANPFFQLMEAMWMLDGRRDAAFLNTYVRDFGERYAEEDGNLWGAYGYRWQHWFGCEDDDDPVDQLERIGEMLRRNHQDRRAVLAMWDGNLDLGADRRDIPCNTHVYFRVFRDYLDMTVCCRSNDIVWGAYGANAVHFAFLQEYMSALVGVRPGMYTQFSNNYHVYEPIYRKMLAAKAHGALDEDGYRESGLEALPLVDDIQTFRRELSDLLTCPRHGAVLSNRFLSHTVLPVAMVHRHWSEGNRHIALEASRAIEAPDWRRACHEWMQRRMLPKED